MNALLLFLLAVLIEGAVEYFVAEPVKKSAPQFVPFIRYVGLAAGIGVALVFKVDLFSLLGLVVPAVPAQILTGIALSRGANYLSDLIGKARG